jgi:hypothetical protein
VEDATPVKKAKAPAKAAKAASPKAPKAPKAPAKAKKEAAPIPEGEDAPTPESYRLSADEINADLCQARKYAAGSEDKRWAPHVYSESQCKRKPVDGTELCQLCTTCFEKESQDEKFKKWLGLITEDPESTTHMLGTEWAAKCKWVGTPAPAPAAEAPEEDSAAAVTEEAVAAAVTAVVSTPPPTTKTVPQSPPKAPVKAVPAKATPAKAPAATAAKAPAKAPAPAKAAAPAPAKAAPAAAKAAAPAAKGKIAAVVPAAAAAVSEPVADAGELKLIGGDFYWVANGNVYEYDQIEEAKGDFVGRLTADETIDGDAEEETV